MIIDSKNYAGVIVEVFHLAISTDSAYSALRHCFSLVCFLKLSISVLEGPGAKGLHAINLVQFIDHVGEEWFAVTALLPI